MSSKSKGKPTGEANRSSLAESMIWVCLTIAAIATVYFLMREPEDGPVTQLPRAMAQARALALGAALLGAIPGIWHIIRRRGDPNLFAMAVLFNIMIASYWILRLTLT